MVKYKTQDDGGRMHVTICAAISVDGKISTRTGDTKLSSKSDKIRLHKIRSQVDAVLIGKNTLRNDDPLLTTRLIKGKNPIRIILDSKGTISSKSKILETCDNVQTIIVATKKINKKNIKRLNKFPIDLIITRTDTINIQSLLDYLYKKKNIHSLLVEGGGKVNWSFIKQNLFDRLIVTVTPYLVGGYQREGAISLINGQGFLTISNSSKLKLDEVHRSKNEVILKYSNLRLLY